MQNHPPGMQPQDHIPPGSVWRHPRLPASSFVRHQPSSLRHRPRSPPVIAPQPDQVGSVKQTFYNGHAHIDSSPLVRAPRPGHTLIDKPHPPLVSAAPVLPGSSGQRARAHIWAARPPPSRQASCASSSNSAVSAPARLNVLITNNIFFFSSVKIPQPVQYSLIFLIEQGNLHGKLPIFHGKNRHHLA